jgi:hypothetical protein
MNFAACDLDVGANNCAWCFVASGRFKRDARNRRDRG